MGHPREYTPPGLAPKLTYHQPPQKVLRQQISLQLKEAYQILNALLPCCLHWTIYQSTCKFQETTHMIVSALNERGGQGAGGSKLPAFHTLHYWLPPLFSCLLPLVVYSQEILVGVCHPVLKILTLLQTKNFIIQT